ncbi:LamG-like jellyroll fold domain-containing protein [Plantactinospora sp. DSM 117369]
MPRPRLRHAVVATTAAALAGLLATTGTATPAQGHGDRHRAVHPELRHRLVAHYDFDHPLRGDPARERDLGRSGTTLDLVNGGAAMRVPDRAHRGSGRAVQTGQVDPGVAGNDDWKAGVYAPTGLPSLHAFNGAAGASVLGWFKMLGDGPAPNSNTADPGDRFNAIGLAGVLTGDSDGHAVRALLELITVDGELRLVALGRRLDGGESQTFAAAADWRTLLPVGEWVFLAATFDFTDGSMALYRNGRPLDGFYTRPDDPWQVAGPGRHRATATDPRGIKIGGSFPQDTREQNPCDCRMDSLMFLDRVVPARQVEKQYRHVTGGR